MEPAAAFHQVGKLKGKWATGGPKEPAAAFHQVDKLMGKRVTGGPIGACRCR